MIQKDKEYERNIKYLNCIVICHMAILTTIIQHSKHFFMLSQIITQDSKW